MTLPTFCDKDAFAVKNFLAHFQNAVGVNPSISDEQDMIYLKSALEGEPFN
jgi:hypothetical protein